MQDTGLYFRPAAAGDLRTIWDLLHAASMGWSEERVAAHLRQMYILSRAGKLLGVLMANPEETAIQWSVVHPLYPESELSCLMRRCYDGLRVVQVGETRKYIHRLNEAPV